MSDTALKKPVVLDETAQKILEAVRSLALREGASREVLAEIKAVLQEIANKTGTGSTGDVPNEVFVIPMLTTITANDDLGFPKSATCSLDGVTIDEIEAAYDDGKLLFADATDTTSGKRYLIPISSFEDAAAYKCWEFASESKKNPLERPSVVSVRKVKSNGTAYITCAASQIKSEFVQCSVTINGTTYTTIADALEALLSSM